MSPGRRRCPPPPGAQPLLQTDGMSSDVSSVRARGLFPLVLHSSFGKMSGLRKINPNGLWLRQPVSPVPLRRGPKVDSCCLLSGCPVTVRRWACSPRLPSLTCWPLSVLDSWVSWTFPRSFSHPVVLSPCPTLSGAEGHFCFLGHCQKCPHVDACSHFGSGPPTLSFATL